MIIGIISDTHDDMYAIKKAVELFNDKNVSHVIHAGDIVSPFTFEIFSGLKSKFTGIFGNNDGDRLLLRQKSEGNLHTQPLIMTFYEKKIVVIHEPDIANALAHSGDFDLIIHGHTHKPEIRKVKDRLVINPGKAARLHKGRATLALLNMERMDAEIIEL